MTTLFTLESLNSLPLPAFTGAVGDVFEHASWVADAVFGHRPFPTVAALHEAMMGVVRSSPAERQLAFIRAHPELGSKVKRLDITPDSQEEQGSLGLDRLSDAEFKTFTTLNAAYAKTFGIPVHHLRAAAYPRLDPARNSNGGCRTIPTPSARRRSMRSD